MGRAETRGCGVWRGGLLLQHGRNAASFTSGRVRRLQQGHALGVVLVLRVCEGRIAPVVHEVHEVLVLRVCEGRIAPVVLEVQPGPGVDEEVRALVVALECGQIKGRQSFLLVG